MAQTYTSLTNQMFELGTDAYRTYIKSLVWGQERVLDYTREMLRRTESFHKEGQGLVEEYAETLRRGQKMAQEMMNNRVKSTQDAFNQYRQVTRDNMQSVNESLDNMQNKVVETVENTTKKAR